MRKEDVQNPGSKPVKWDERLKKIIYHLALLGATDKEIAEALDVDINTLDYWKRTKPDLLQALNDGKGLADAKAAESFFKCVTGYEYEEEVPITYKGEVTEIIKIKKFRHPDAWAANKWLSLRQRDKWSETHKVEITQTNINITKIDLTGLSMEELLLAEKLGMKQLAQNAGAGNNIN